MTQPQQFDPFHRVIVIDWDLCRQCHISNDNWGRQGVTPFALACYLYHAIHTLGKTADEAITAIMTKWDSLVWRTSPINIVLWNKLFNGFTLTQSEWSKILFPFRYIDTIRTSVTSPSTKHDCYPLFLTDSKKVPSEFLVCTAESYRKAVTNKTAAKVTAYRYGYATQNTDILQGLREETSRVILPF